MRNYRLLDSNTKIGRRGRLASPWVSSRPEPRKSEIAEILDTLALAQDVKLEVGGEQKQTADLIRDGKYIVVIKGLFDRRLDSGAEYNNYGCALAHKKRWTEAERALQTAADKGHAEAAQNLKIVRRARRRS